jgi:hypothetical protein
MNAKRLQHHGEFGQRFYRQVALQAAHNNGNLNLSRYACLS